MVVRITAKADASRRTKSRCGILSAPKILRTMSKTATLPDVGPCVLVQDERWMGWLPLSEIEVALEDS